MEKQKKHSISEGQRKLDTDLWIIVLATFGTYGLYMVFGSQMMDYIKNSQNSILLRLMLNAGIQFGIAGLGISIVSILRREKFSSFGLNGKNIGKAILGAVVCWIPYICFIFFTGNFDGYHPLHILITEDILQSDFPMNIFGMAVIAIVWGFFEGFNYGVICDKLNARYPSKKQWLDVGAITCAVICILFHSLQFSLEGIFEMLTTLIGIYGMLMVKKQTKNAWGLVFVFCFIWNAF